jgi:3-oxoadipate enol-lactonase
MLDPAARPVQDHRLKEAGENTMLLPVDGWRIYYDLAGAEERPVVCMTHSLAADGGMWAEQLPPLLAAGFRVLRIDMRGHGGSDPVAGDYTMSALAGDVIRVLDALGIERAHYIGLSIGGMIGQALAIEHGHRVISAMWCDTLPAAPSGGAQVWAERIQTVKQANSVQPLAEGTMDRWFTPAFKPRNPGRWKQIYDTVAGTTPAGFLGCAAGIMNFDFVSGLASVRQPVLVVCGDEDQGTPAAENRRLAGLVANGRYEEIASARHFPNVEHPDQFSRIMLDWLASQR